MLFLFHSKVKKVKRLKQLKFVDNHYHHRYTIYMNRAYKPYSAYVNVYNLGFYLQLTSIIIKHRLVYTHLFKFYSKIDIFNGK